MTYATRNDIEELWGERFAEDLLPQEIAEDPSRVADALASALARAGEEVDAHLSARYSVPLAKPAAVLVMPAANIAVYLMANRHSALTTTIQDRYEQSIKLLQRIADGKAGLGADEPKVSNDPDTSAGGAYFGAAPRRFGRDLP